MSEAGPAVHGRKKIVLLGLMTEIPVAGVAWVTAHYLIGFQRLGYDVYYVEQHARAPRDLMQGPDDDGAVRAAAYIAGIMHRLDLDGHWAYQALHDDGRCLGMSESQLAQLFDSAHLVINLHGATVPRPEHQRAGCFIFLETDPVDLEIELYNNVQEAIDFLAPHDAFFTWASNYGSSDCKLPVSDRFHFQPTVPPVVVDFWQNAHRDPGEVFTTIGNWRQVDRVVSFQGEVYHWSKHLEFLKFFDLPRQTDQRFELALSLCHETEQRRLEAEGWRVRLAADVSRDMDTYRHYIQHSRGEFTVAKDQNVRLRTGWFSERSATYLAAGRPVITQDTGFSNSVPSGQGLFSFLTMGEILAAVDDINAEYGLHSRSAREIARDYFNYDVVLSRLLTQVGL